VSNVDAQNGSDKAVGSFEPGAADPSLDAEIVSVNSKSNQASAKTGKALFIIVCLAMSVAALFYMGKSYVDGAKASARAGKAKNTGDEVDPLNPEATKGPTIAKLGAASGKAPPKVEEPVVPRTPGIPETQGVRPITGADGKVMVDPQGRALGVDPSGKIVQVPAIALVGGEVSKSSGSPSAAAAVPAGGPTPSRYGGSLFVEKASLQGSTAGTAASNNAAGGSLSSADKARQMTIEAQMEMAQALLKQQQQGQPSSNPQPVPAPAATPYVGQPVPPPSAPASGASGAFGGQPDAAAGGSGGNAPAASATTVARDMVRTVTPVAVASRFADQDLMLPKGRQADCVLTTRVDDQLPGFTSCALLNDLYSDNGKTLLLERGSEFWGEYGQINQAGVSRIAANWVRIKTPDGVTVDLSSPGSDTLGGSGMPGHYNPRWPERIGAALLLSVMKDVMSAVIANQSKGGASVVVSPGQNTIQGAGNIADQVIRETLRVRPNVTINEGTRIAIYVARDLDFRRVYELRHAAKVAKDLRQ
jgi:type IV secretion system protein VirB10